MPNVINTLKESSLHRTLKTLYSLEDGCCVEAEQDGKIYDIIDGSGGIIEIQTQNLSKLFAKADAALKTGRRFKIVHPIALRKTIELYGSGGLISRRASPKRGCIYQILRELTGLYPLLLHDGFTLEVLLIRMTERRMRTETAVQSENKRRRFKRNWIKTDKLLEEIIETKIFSCAKDYLRLIPDGTPELFSARILRNCILTDKSLPASAGSFAGLLLWLFCRMNLIEPVQADSRAKIYRIKPDVKQADA